MNSQLYLPLPPYYRRCVVGGRLAAADPSLHHLQKVNGVWCVRVSLDRGPKLVAERVKKSLGTGDVSEAKIRRDIFIAGLIAAGRKLARTSGRADLW
jgi:hypothetical protein